MLDVDVAIIGGGPGGTAAAITAATAGLQVIVLERQSFPRSRPGETLHPGAESVLAQLGLAAGALMESGDLRHAGVWFELNEERRFEPYGADVDGPWLGLQIPRDHLDARLLERATIVGAAVRQPCRVRDARPTAGNRIDLATDRGRIRTRWIIDAGGGRHWLARRWSIPIRPRSTPLLARYGYAAGECAALDGAPTFRVDRDGWTWTARVAPGRYHWTRLSFGQRSPEGSAPSVLSGLPLHTRALEENVTWRQAERLAGDGYFLVGDAAAVLDPASSKGVLRALMSGIMAAHLIARVTEGRLTGLAAAQKYHRWLHQWLESDIWKLRSWYDEAKLPPWQQPANAPAS